MSLIHFIRFIVYVTCLYLIFQLLTRSDEHEILSHLPPSLHPPSLIPSLHSHSAQSQSQSSTYPYHIPHIPNPLPTSPDTSSKSGIYRLTLGILIYPFYLLLQIIAIPLPLLVGVLWWIVALLINLAYPITGTTRLLWGTFVLVPWGVVRGFGRLIYPIWVFVGGVVGIGLILGLGFGWIGQRIWVLMGYGSVSRDGDRERRTEKGRNQVKGKDKEKKGGSGHSVLSQSTYEGKNENTREGAGNRGVESERRRERRRIRSPSSAESVERVKTPRSARFAESDYEASGARFKAGRDWDDIREAKRQDGTGMGRSTGRQGVALGVRRRTHGLDERRDR